MKKKWIVILSLVAVTLAILTACGAAAATEPLREEPAPPEEFAAPAMPEMGADAVGEQAEMPALPMPTAGVVYQTLPDVENAPGQAATIDRKIIKTAEVSVLVEDSDIAIDRLTQVVGDVDGYIISSRVWFQPHFDGENYKYATVTMGVPVDMFEVTMRRVRALALRVLDENASGEDVTDQFVDLQSRLTNLQATQERIKSFLDDARTVDEALRINQELASIEAQIEEVKGRMNYLSDRSAFSTITVTISPQLPEIATPTPTPTATPKPWNPGDTLDDATDTLVGAYQGIVEFAIWLFVAVLPILVPPALVIWLVFRLVRGKPAKEPVESKK